MGERYLPVVIDKASPFDVEGLKKPNLNDVFGGLPIARGVNLDFFSPLIVVGADLNDLKKVVVDRYLDIYNKRKDAGFGNLPEINCEMAIALLKPSLYEELIKTVDGEAATIAVARHEVGHKLVASNLGWHVKSVTVVPNGYYLGLTESIPPRGLGFDDWLLESAAISFGGKIAAIMSGDDACGTGADMASAEAKAKLAVSFPGSRFSSESAFIREAENIASRALSSVGVSALNRDALIVLHKQTIAA